MANSNGKQARKKVGGNRHTIKRGGAKSPYQKHKKTPVRWFSKKGADVEVGVA